MVDFGNFLLFVKIAICQIFSSSPPFCLFSSSFFLFLLLLSEYLPTEHGTHEGKIHKIGYCGSNKQYSSSRVRLLVHSVNYPFTFWNNWRPFSESPFFFTHNRIFIIKNLSSQLLLWSTQSQKGTSHYLDIEILQE